VAGVDMDAPAGGVKSASMTKIAPQNDAPDAQADDRKARARAWFEGLRDQIIAAFEALEDAADPALYPGPAGRFEKTPWTRPTGNGGGVMSMMHGRLFEKVGVHTSTVNGTFSPEMARTMPGAAEDPRYFATSISLIAHMASPRVPAVHMNTRFFSTQKTWFGGGADLTPLLADQRSQDAPDAAAFHAAMKAACDAHDPAWHPKYKAWCDEYFFLPHRNETRGVGGIFFDHHDSGDFEGDFAFVQDVGRAFLASYPKIVAGRMGEPWSAEEREEQLIRRGRYVEFNLLYDRGTTFGLKTGGNVDTILSSMPPVVKWP
jgi:coproporphyrinogen III oxidase